jgi:hypothetical protein
LGNDETSANVDVDIRAFHNDQLGVFEEYVTKYFGFDKALPMKQVPKQLKLLKLQENGL